MTTAYKKKLIEDQKWIEKQKEVDKKEMEEDVKKRKGMKEFYKNLISGNNKSVGSLETTIKGEDISQIADEDIKNINIEEEKRKLEKKNIYTLEKRDSRSRSRSRHRRHHR